MDHFDIFAQTLGQCIDVMFVGDGKNICHPATAPEPSETDVVLASMGFACEGARGSVLLLATRESASMALPSGIDWTAEGVDCDAVGELTNMLVGSMKNQLLGRGLVLLVGTPLSTIARTARVLASTEPTTTSTWFAVAQPGGCLHIRLDASFEADFEIKIRPESVRSAGAEGEMLFF